MAKRVKFKIPATSANLGPGFDVVGIALKLYNTTEVTLLSDGVAGAGKFISIEGEGKGCIPENESNIVWAAMKSVFLSHCAKGWEKKYSPRTISIKIKNDIPVGAGLGSSAAARLGGILAADAIAGTKLSQNEIINAGSRLEGHSDNIVPAICGGLCISLKAEDDIKYLKLKTPRLKAVICTPGFQLSTKRSREVLPQKVSLAQAVFNCQRTAFLVASFQMQDFDLLRLSMDDKLHQPYREKLVPNMKEVFDSAKQAGALGVALSGAGSSIIAFCPAGKAIRIANAMSSKWKKYGINSKSRVLEFDPKGASQCR